MLTVDAVVISAVAALAWVRQQWNLTADTPPRYLFPKTTGNRHATRPWGTGNYSRVLREFSRALGLRDGDGQLLLYSRSHRLRHTKATTSLNAGAPLHVVQRYLGHLSPEMTMRHAATLASTAEREFLAMVKIGRDGREIGTDRRDRLDLMQLDRRTDRILPNGYCLLPPARPPASSTSSPRNSTRNAPAGELLCRTLEQRLTAAHGELLRLRRKLQAHGIEAAD
jgi:hypothetical protein